MSWIDVAEVPGGAEAAGGTAGRLAAGARRSVAVPLTAVRQHVLAAVRERGFTLTTEQLTVIEGARGSALGAVTLQPAKIPVGVSIGLESTDDGGCGVTVRIVDRWPAKVGRNWGATAAYQDVFAEVLAAVDGVLARLDPAASSAFPPWWRRVGPGDVAVMQNAAGWAAQAGSALSRHTSRLLDGSGPRSGTPVSRTGAGTFTFLAPGKVAEVPPQLADGMLTVGTLITSRPGQMPTHLVAQIQSLVYRVEEYVAATAATAGDGGSFRFTVDTADVPVVVFLHQQAQLRELLPVRTLQVCTTCRLEKIVNPELERLQERNRRTRDLATTVSAVISPFVLAGRLAQSRGPAFACPRCQGLSAEESVVTFCRRCGDRRAETALRTCDKCAFDFRSLLPGGALWTDARAEPPAAPVPSSPHAGTPAAPAAVVAPRPPDADDAALAPRPPRPGTAAPRPEPAAAPAEESWPRPPGS